MQNQAYVPLSWFLQLVHLKPLSLKENAVKSSFCLQFTHSLTFGANPIIFISLILNTAVIKSKSLSVSEIAYNVFKYNFKI